MKIELKTIFGDLIFEGDFASVAEAVKAALKEKKSLSSANLSYADLRSANLRYANLSSANLSSANLSYADLSSANLRYANLRYADLRYANLSSANLSYADLSYADLRSANLRSANLSSANLSSANLSYADLSSAKNAKLAIARTRIVPEGSLIGWKKCRDDVIVKLRIPEEAKRSHAFGRKCRAEFAEVLFVYGAEKGVSLYDGKTEYRKGDKITPDSFSDDWMQECANGVHFYITREEAEAHL